MIKYVPPLPPEHYKPGALKFDISPFLPNIFTNRFKYRGPAAYIYLEQLLKTMSRMQDGATFKLDKTLYIITVDECAH